MNRAVIAIAVGATLGTTGCGSISPENVSAQLESGAPALPTSSLGSTAAGVTTDQCARAAVPQAHEVWRRRVGGDDVLHPTSVATDGSGNTFAAQATGGTTMMTEGGDLVWAKPFGSLVGANAAGDVVVAGTFSAPLDLDASHHLDSAGGSDIYVGKLDSAGNVVFAQAFGGTEDDKVDSLAIDADGSTVVSGPGIGTIKVDGNGVAAWSKPFHGAVAIDSMGAVVVTGSLIGTASFGGDALVSAGGEDVFVAKLDPAGNHLWSARFGDLGGAQHGEAVAIDPSDNVVIGGVFDGTVDFGGGPLAAKSGSCPAESWCKAAGFVVKLDSSGHHVFSRSMTPVRSIQGVAVDSLGSVFVSGAYPGNAQPYRSLLLLQFDSQGRDVALAAHLASDLTTGGAGHGITVDRCDRVLWTLSAPLGSERVESSFLAKLEP
jgi:hypothetical protein